MTWSMSVFAAHFLMLRICCQIGECVSLIGERVSQIAFYLFAVFPECAMRVLSK